MRVDRVFYSITSPRDFLTISSNHSRHVPKEKKKESAFLNIKNVLTLTLPLILQYFVFSLVPFPYNEKTEVTGLNKQKAKSPAYSTHATEPALNQLQTSQ